MRPVQNRHECKQTNLHAEKMLIVKVVAEVIDRPAIPAETKPERANSVVTYTATAPSTSELSESQRFVIQKVHCETHCISISKNREGSTDPFTEQACGN